MCREWKTKNKCYVFWLSPAVLPWSGCPSFQVRTCLHQIRHGLNLHLDADAGSSHGDTATGLSLGWGDISPTPAAQRPWPRNLVDHQLPAGSAVASGFRQVLAGSAEGVRNSCSTVGGLIIFPDEISLGYRPMLRTAICYGGFQFFGHDPLSALHLITWCHKIPFPLL